MPLIELYRNIKIKMYFNDHNPPHFHVEQAEFEAVFSIENCEQIAGGKLPRKLKSDVFSYWLDNKQTLIDKWDELNERDY